MNSIFVQIYIVVVALSFIAIWARHYWLIRSLDKHMDKFHKSNWQEMKEDTGWFRPNWATLYYSKAVYDFVWRSTDTLSDDNILIIRKRIKRFIWELPLFFVIITVLTVLLILISNN